MGIEILMLASLSGVIAFLSWLLWAQRKQFSEIEAKLLDRIMSRDYAQLVQADIAKKEAERSLTAEEIFEMQQERGIPV